MTDLHNTLKARVAVNPNRVIDNTAQVGAIIDRSGYEGLEFLIAMGTIADVDATVTPNIQHGDQADLSDADNVPAGDLFGTFAGATFAAADDNELRKIGYRGTKRYVRLVLTPANNTGNLDLAAVAILKPMKGPESSQEG